MLSSHFMRLLLRSIKWTAETSSLTLWNALKAAAQARISETASGKALVASSGNGMSVSFQIPAGISPVAAAEAVSYLLDLYELIDGASPAPADDTARFNAMMGELKPITSTFGDFSGLRFTGGRFLQ